MSGTGQYPRASFSLLADVTMTRAPSASPGIQREKNNGDTIADTDARDPVADSNNLAGAL